MRPRQPEWVRGGQEPGRVTAGAPRWVRRRLPPETRERVRLPAPGVVLHAADEPRAPEAQVDVRVSSLPERIP